nr:MAG: hypothetical protein DIU57_20500 [Pseudomonadota bacterium]
MRLLFLFLLMLNLAFFAWMTNRQPGKSNAVPAAETQYRSLILLHEQQPAFRDPQAPQPEVKQAARQSEGGFRR